MFASESAALWLLVTGTFLAAGFVKGTVGLGLPSVAMGLLTLSLPPVQAASLMLLPLLVTNLWQMLAGPALRAMVRRFASMMLLSFAGTLATAGAMSGDRARLAAFGLGVVLVISAALGLSSLRLRVRRDRERGLSPLMGLATGLITGATGAFIFPSVPYLAAMDLSKEELIQALGLSAVVSSVALGTALYLQGTLSLPLAGVSVYALLPAFAGMIAGQQLRRHVSEQAFRKVFQSGILLLGLFLAFKNLS